MRQIIAQLEESDRNSQLRDEQLLSRLRQTLVYVQRDLEAEISELYGAEIDESAERSLSRAARESKARGLLAQIDLVNRLSGTASDQPGMRERYIQEAEEAATRAQRILSDVSPDAAAGASAVGFGSFVDLSRLSKVYENSRARLRNYETEAAKNIEDHVVQGLAKQAPWRQTAREIRSDLDLLRYQAERIVRTESVAVADEARRETYQQNGVRFVMRIATQDARVCPFCAARAGKVYEAAEAPSLIHPNDRCINVPWSPEWVGTDLLDQEWVDEHVREVEDKLKRQGQKPNPGRTWIEINDGRQQPRAVWTPRGGFSDYGRVRIKEPWVPPTRPIGWGIEPSTPDPDFDAGDIYDELFSDDESTEEEEAARGPDLDVDIPNVSRDDWDEDEWKFIVHAYTNDRLYFPSGWDSERVKSSIEGRIDFAKSMGRFEENIAEFMASDPSPSVGESEEKLGLVDDSGSEVKLRGFHVSTPENIESIVSDGFKIDEKGSSYYGTGVYISLDRADEFYGRDAVELDVNLQNPYFHQITSDHADSLASTREGAPFAEEIQRLTDENPGMVKGEALRRILVGRGYDGVITVEDGSPIVVAFNEESISVLGRGDPGSFEERDVDLASLVPPPSFDPPETDVDALKDILENSGASIRAGLEDDVSPFIAANLYTDSGYLEINSKLRGDDYQLNPRLFVDEGHLSRVIGELDRPFSDARLEQDMYLYRGLTLPKDSVDPSNLVGTVIEDDGFVSTSLNQDIAKGYSFRTTSEYQMTIRIRAPEGTSAVYVAPASEEGEDEILLPRGTGLRIVEINSSESTDYFGSKIEKFELTAEIVPVGDDVLQARSDYRPERSFASSREARESLLASPAAEIRNQRAELEDRLTEVSDRRSTLYKAYDGYQDLMMSTDAAEYTRLDAEWGVIMDELAEIPKIKELRDDLLTHVVPEDGITLQPSNPDFVDTMPQSVQDYYGDRIMSRVDESVREGFKSFGILSAPRSTLDEKEVEVEIGPKNQRAYYNEGKIVLAPHVGSNQVETTIHELGHWLEDNDSETFELAKEFLDRRTAGSILTPLNEMGENKTYGPDEVAMDGGFFDPYVGRIYMLRDINNPERDGEIYATEIVSMGLERMYQDPVRFAEEDPEHFELIHTVMHGLHEKGYLGEGEGPSLEVTEDEEPDGIVQTVMAPLRFEPRVASPDEMAEAFNGQEFDLTTFEDEEVVDAFSQYEGPSYRYVNNALRGDLRRMSDEKAEEGLELAARMDRAFADSPGLPEDTVLYRGLRLREGSVDPDNLLGTVLDDEGFVSTSLDRDVADRFSEGGPREISTVVRIEAPRGTPGVYLHGISEKGEYEVTMPRGTGLEIVDVEKEEYVDINGYERIRLNLTARPVPPDQEELRRRVTGSEPRMASPSRVLTGDEAEEALRDSSADARNLSVDDETFREIVDDYQAVNLEARGLLTPEVDGVYVNYERDKEKAKRLVAELDRAFEEDPQLPEDMIAHRTIRIPAGTFDSDRIQGAILRDPGFLSTSLSEMPSWRLPSDSDIARSGEQFVSMEVRMPRGTRALTPSEIYQIGLSREEVLLPRGTGLKVVSAQREEVEADGSRAEKLNLVVEVVPAENMREIDPNGPGTGFPEPLYAEEEPEPEPPYDEEEPEPTPPPPTRSASSASTSDVAGRIKEESGDPSMDEVMEVLAFTEGNSPDINEELRGERRDSTAAMKVWQLDRVVAGAAPMPVDGFEVYRGASIPKSELDLGSLLGSRIDNEGFMSTSTSQATAQRYARSTDDEYAVSMTIRTRKGQRTVWVDEGTGEYEVILPRGTQLEVVEVRSIDGDRVELVAEAVPVEEETLQRRAKTPQERADEKIESVREQILSRHATNVQAAQMGREIDRLDRMAMSAGSREEEENLQMEIMDLRSDQRRLLEEEGRDPREILAELEPEEPSDVNIIEPDEGELKAEAWDRAKVGIEAFNRMVTGQSGQRPIRIEAADGGRAAFDAVDMVMKLDAGDVWEQQTSTTVHELGHWLEETDPWVLEEAVAFYERRTEGRGRQHLGFGFEDDEYAKDGGFFDPYVGKVYRDSRSRRIVATEVTAMGLERMYNDPVKFAVEDPEHFRLIYRIMHSMERRQYA